MEEIKPKQVFSTYNRHRATTHDILKYCPRCAERFIFKERGGRKRLYCNKCGFIYYRNPYPGVVVLIEKNGKVLLCKRDHTSYMGEKWCLPGGFVEFDEDFLSAACRETKEETGINIEIRSIISVVTNYFTSDLHTLVVVLSARVVSGELCAGDDIIALDWLPLSGPFPEMAFDADVHIIERYWKTELRGAPVDPDFATTRDPLENDL